MVIKKAVKFAYGGFGASVEYSTFEMEVSDPVIALVEVSHYWVLTGNPNYSFLHPQVFPCSNPFYLHLCIPRFTFSSPNPQRRFNHSIVSICAKPHSNNLLSSMLRSLNLQHRPLMVAMSTTSIVHTSTPMYLSPKKPRERKMSKRSGIGEIRKTNSKRPQRNER